MPLEKIFAFWICRAPTVLYPRSLDERVTCNVLMGRAEGEKRPRFSVVHLERNELASQFAFGFSGKALGLTLRSCSEYVGCS
jgi:hypothetical protein